MTAEFRVRTVATRDGDVEIEVRGPKGAPAVAFVHGAGVAKATWLPQLRALSDRYRVAAVDLPGHGGRSDERFSMDAAVRSLKAAVTVVGGEAVVVGHSLGGYVALEFADEHPGRTRALVLSGASADYRARLGLKTRLGGTLRQIAGRVGPLRRRFERSTAERIRALPIEDHVAEAVIDGGFSLRAWGEAGNALVGVDYPAKRRRFGGPILLVNGEEDRLNAPVAEAVAADGSEPGVRVATIPNAGHLCNLEAPEAFTAVLASFLDGLATPED